MVDLSIAMVVHQRVSKYIKYPLRSPLIMRLSNTHRRQGEILFMRNPKTTSEILLEIMVNDLGLFENREYTFKYMGLSENVVYPYTQWFC